MTFFKWYNLLLLFFTEASLSSNPLLAYIYNGISKKVKNRMIQIFFLQKINLNWINNRRFKTNSIEIIVTLQIVRKLLNIKVIWKCKFVLTCICVLVYTFLIEFVRQIFTDILTPKIKIIHSKTFPSKEN